MKGDPMKVQICPSGEHPVPRRWTLETVELADVTMLGRQSWTEDDWFGECFMH